MKSCVLNGFMLFFLVVNIELNMEVGWIDIIWCYFIILFDWCIKFFDICNNIIIIYKIVLIEVDIIELMYKKLYVLR